MAERATLGTSVCLTSVLLPLLSQSFVLKAEPDAAPELSFRAENKLGKEGSMQGGSRTRNVACPRKVWLRSGHRRGRHPIQRGWTKEAGNRSVANPLPGHSPFSRSASS